MLSRAVTIAILAAGSLLYPATASAASDIIDISYDKCQSPGSSRVASWVGHHDVGIVGVNGGGDWEKNSCLGNETKHFDKYMLYVNTNYPSDGCHQSISRKAAYHCGYNLGLWDLNYASSQGAHSNIWFVDVEEGAGIPWSGSDSINSAFLYGLAKALEAHGAYMGWYSTSSQWDSVTGGWHPGGFVWYATGSHGRPSSGTIHDACRSNFTRGIGVSYFQYIDGGLDHNDYC
jgi:hypothetical protein